jgi:hypothetical protein
MKLDSPNRNLPTYAPEPPPRPHGRIDDTPWHEPRGLSLDEAIEAVERAASPSWWARLVSWR